MDDQGRHTFCAVFMATRENNDLFDHWFAADHTLTPALAGPGPASFTRFFIILKKIQKVFQLAFSLQHFRLVNNFVVFVFLFQSGDLMLLDFVVTLQVLIDFLAWRSEERR